MRVTTRGRYAIRASLALAKLGIAGLPVSISQLSEEEDISPVFLEQIFFRLRKAGIVNSIRGPGGGFTFARPPEKLALIEILEAAGEEFNLIHCDKHLSDCRRSSECLSHYIWEDLYKMIKDYFAKITLASIINKYKDINDIPGIRNS